MKIKRYASWLLGIFAFTAFGLALAQVPPPPGVLPSLGGCQLYSSTTPVPAGYGAAYDVLSAGKELLMQVLCNASGATVNVGKGSSSQIIYNQGYKWMTSQNKWVPITYSGTPYSGNASWLSASAAGPIPASQVESGTNYVVAYVCTNVNGSWQCGCSDNSCATHSWNLQAFTPNTTSGGGGGGSTCDTQAFAAKLNEAADAADAGNTNLGIQKLKAAKDIYKACTPADLATLSCDKAGIANHLKLALAAYKAGNIHSVAQHVRDTATIIAATCRSSTGSGSGSSSSGSGGGSTEFGPVSYHGKFMIIAMPLPESAFVARKVEQHGCNPGIGCGEDLSFNDGPGIKDEGQVEAWWIARHEGFQACQLSSPSGGVSIVEHFVPLVGSTLDNVPSLASQNAQYGNGITRGGGVGFDITCGVKMQTPQGTILVHPNSVFAGNMPYTPSGQLKDGGEFTGAYVDPSYPSSADPIMAATSVLPTKEGRDILLTINGTKVKGDPGRPTYVSVEGSATATWQAPPEYTSCAMHQPFGLPTGISHWLRLPPSGSRGISLVADIRAPARGLTSNPMGRFTIICAGPDYMPVVKSAIVVGG